MTSKRPKIGEADRRHIIGRSGGRCNLCRLELFIDNEFGESARLGDDAHINAFSNYGPRSDPNRSQQERSSRQNLILLCKTCHSKVDQQSTEYTESRLHELRNAHYAWVESRLGDNVILKPRFHYLSYVNVSRVDMYAVINSIALPSFPFSFEGKSSIRDLGFNAGRLMAGYTNVLNHEAFYANPLNADTSLNDISVGSYWFSAQTNFRSRKVLEQSDLVSAWEQLESTVYRKFDGWRLYCLIDPRWITTTSAYSTLRSGSFQSMGLVHINKVDTQKGVAIASPLFLGAQDGGFFL